MELRVWFCRENVNYVVLELGYGWEGFENSLY